MTRPLLLLAAGAVLAGAPGCGGGGAERAPPPGGFAYAAPPQPPARRAPPPAAAGRSGTFASPAPAAGARDRAAAIEACRRDADRIVLYRDRGQLMREDERDARVGTDASIYARRAETDRLGRAFERDRIAAECLEQTPGTAPTPPRP